jgi:hypothetical protein
VILSGGRGRAIERERVRMWMADRRIKWTWGRGGGREGRLCGCHINTVEEVLLRRGLWTDGRSWRRSRAARKKAHQSGHVYECGARTRYARQVP